MNIAEQVKATFVKTNMSNGQETFDMNEIVEHCEDLTNDVDQDWESESTQFNFADNSSLVVSFDNVSAYGSKQ